ncbi:MAG: hypothetical protein M1831_000967 [Alyxoria varia]|nr:MAG: hypothetical protein M1831_000967 [Alyxoria varia]
MLCIKLSTFLLTLLLAPTPLLAKLLFTDYTGTLDPHGNKLTTLNATGTLLFDHTSGGALNHTTTTPSRTTNSTNNTLRKRFWPWERDYISSCGREWIPVKNFQSYTGERFIGYDAAAAAFCEHMCLPRHDGKGVVVGPRAYAASTIVEGDDGEKVGLDDGKDPLRYGRRGSIHFEIHNKMLNHWHTPAYNDCVSYLSKMSHPMSKCFGYQNDDTKGGTWQVGYDDISYHGLAHKLDK